MEDEPGFLSGGEILSSQDLSISAADGPSGFLPCEESCTDANWYHAVDMITIPALALKHLLNLVAERVKPETLGTTIKHGT
jgi:hypothetical protein